MALIVPILKFAVNVAHLQLASLNMLADVSVKSARLGIHTTEFIAFLIRIVTKVTKQPLIAFFN